MKTLIPTLFLIFSAQSFAAESTIETVDRYGLSNTEANQKLLELDKNEQCAAIKRRVMVFSQNYKAKTIKKKYKSQALKDACRLEKIYKTRGCINKVNSTHIGVPTKDMIAMCGPRTQKKPQSIAEKIDNETCQQLKEKVIRFNKIYTANTITSIDMLKEGFENACYRNQRFVDLGCEHPVSKSKSIGVSRKRITKFCNPNPSDFYLQEGNGGAID